MDLLFITNGHGEDAVAAVLARELPGLALAALPLVGTGPACRAAGLPVLGPARDLPSGGWGQRSLAAFVRDWRQGWPASFREALAAARHVTPRQVVGVGDVLPAAFAAIAGFPPIVLVGCNKTDFYAAWGESYIAAEIAALRCWNTELLPRDEITATRLARLGLRSRFLGNVIPDLVGPLPPPGEGIALLPGSRLDARANLPLMLEALRLLGPAAGSAAVALAPGLDDLRDPAEAASVAVTDLAGALAPAAVAIATAGTATEVAAAHGRPIIAFAGPGPQYTPYFATRQKDLLGDVLALCERTPEAVAATVRRVLEDEGLRERAKTLGPARIGEAGAAARVAHFLASRLPSPK